MLQICIWRGSAGKIVDKNGIYLLGKYFLTYPAVAVTNRIIKDAIIVEM